MTVEPELLRSVMGHFATGVAIVTGTDDGEPVGLTVQSLVSASLEPPLLLFCPKKSSVSWPRIARGEEFAVNILHADQRALCSGFARSGGEKFAGIDWRPGVSGAPLLVGALAFAECETYAIHEAGDHLVVLGLVVELGTLDTGSPLVYYRGEFAALAG
jgi:3-hydroxy-9,10-secoandrosta-1,3,5(10)-triene-9,17-dione monooxygenase reductase component